MSYDSTEIRDIFKFKLFSHNYQIIIIIIIIKASRN